MPRSPRRPAPHAPRRSRKPYHHGDLKRALVDTAAALLEERGPEGLTVRAVAQRAGVTHPAAYNHFADKAALLAALAVRGFEGLYERLLAARERAGAEPMLQLEALAAAYLGFARKNPALFTLMFRELEIGEPPESLRTSELLALQVVVAIVEHGQSRGELPPGDPRMLAIAAMTMIHGLATLALAGFRFHQAPRDPAAPELSKALLALLRGQGKPARK